MFSSFLHRLALLDKYQPILSSIHKQIKLYSQCETFLVKCDDIQHCNESNVETQGNCVADEFTCQCYKRNPPTCSYDSACIPMERYHDEEMDCTDGSDETPFLNNVQCGDCNVTLRRLNSVSECNQIGFPECVSSTCYTTRSLNCSEYSCSKTDVICSSHCSNTHASCQTPFQCSDGSLMLASQFCNGFIDCPDNSDEIINQPGFKCKNSPTACIMPQRNLYDNTEQCDNGNDVCDDSNSCFQCLDNQLLISSAQVCDDQYNCYDLSDECLCIENIDYFGGITSLYCHALLMRKNVSSNSICYSDSLKLRRFRENFFHRYPLFANLQEEILAKFLKQRKNSKTRKCPTSNGTTTPTLCDKRPECADLRDECNYICKQPLPCYCRRDSFNNSFSIGDRFCDGVEDIINHPNCPQGYDEKDCLERFPCKANGNVSIKWEQICDGNKDCDDGADEINCNRKNSIGLTDSTYHVIPIFGSIILIFNLLAVLYTVKMFRSKQLSDSIWMQHIIIVNIFIADSLLGIYFLSIFSEEVIWRKNSDFHTFKGHLSLGCSYLASLTVTGCLASALFMAILTAFRLKNIFNPFASYSTSTWPWRTCVFSAWMIAIVIAVVPLFNHDYFVTGTIYSNKLFLGNDYYFSSHSHYLFAFVCRYAAWANKSLDKQSSWKAPGFFPEANFHPPHKEGIVGFYNSILQSACSPKLLVTKSDSAWEYTIALLSLRCTLFVFIALSYIAIYFYTKQKKIKLHQNNKSNAKKQATMQKRIARIIATDFCCWVPISIVAFVDVPSTYIIHAFVIPIMISINGVMSPFLYSPLTDMLMQKICCCRKIKRKNKIKVVAGN